MDKEPVKAHSFLKKISGPDAGQIYPLYSSLCTIGRSVNCTVCLHVPFLSRRHCSISHEPPNWIITDQGGLNGTYVNGKKMESCSYQNLTDKTIFFLGDPEESTCGFIFLTSLPASAQQAESGAQASSSSSFVPAPGPSSPQSSQELPSLSALMQMASTSSGASISPPEQSQDVSSARSALDVDSKKERLCRPFVPMPEVKRKFRDRIERLKQMDPSQNSVSALNDRMLPILYDASITSPRSTLRVNMGPYPQIRYLRQNDGITPFPTPSTFSDSSDEESSFEAPRHKVSFIKSSKDSSTARRTCPYVPRTSRASAVDQNNPLSHNPSLTSLNNDVSLSEIPRQIISETFDPESSRDTSTARRTCPYVPGSSRANALDQNNPLPYNPCSLTSPNSNVDLNETPKQTVSRTLESELSRDSSTAARTCPIVPGSSRASAPEFDVLDVLVDSVDSHCSDDSNCSISSMDSLRTRIRKRKFRSNRGKQSSNNSPSKGLNTSSSNEDYKVSRQRLNGSEESLDSLSSEDSESLIRNIEDGVKGCETKLGDEDWMSASKPDDSDAIQYLKDQVLKLQKNAMDAAEELKNAIKKNKEQQSIILALQTTQGVSIEQLTEDLESELSCNICTEVLVQPVILDCGHIFCQYCIGVWKKKKRQCPNCRDPIRTECEVKVLDSYIGKVVDRMEPMYRMKRNELIEARKSLKVKSKVSRKPRSSPYIVPVPTSSLDLNYGPNTRSFHRLNAPLQSSRARMRNMQNIIRRMGLNIHNQSVSG